MNGANTAVVEEIAGKGSFIENCTGCNLCVKECSFLQRSGNPADVARGGRDCDPFECTLCGLCSAVCPFGVDPSVYFLEQRRKLRREKGNDDPRHAPLISYEKRGNSGLYSFYGLPEGCDTIFFPGCALPGTRPQAVFELYQRLKTHLPKLGIVLDCCLKPSHDLGREEHFEKTFGELRDHLYGQGIRNVLVACPNCNRIFGDYGGGISVKTVYEILAELPGEAREELGAEAVFHDPCVARCNRAAQDAARKMVAASGVTVAEMKHSRDKTLCCGRGGGVNFVRPGIVEESVASRVLEAEGRPIVTYCAACAGTYAEKTRAMHLLDLWMSPREALAGKVKVSTAPMTYLNRILLKNKLRRGGAFPEGRGRVQHQPRKKKGRFRAAGVLLALAALSYMLGVAGSSGW